MKKTNNKWKTNKCCLCDESHNNYTGKLDSDKREYVICGNVQKKIFVSDNCVNGWIKI